MGLNQSQSVLIFVFMIIKLGDERFCTEKLFSPRGQLLASVKVCIHGVNFEQIKPICGTKRQPEKYDLKFERSVAWKRLVTDCSACDAQEHAQSASN